jgi:topoisomerase IV subunit B
MTTLHAGGKFDSKVYETSGGLHGVGISVVNALSEVLEVEVARGRQHYRQSFLARRAAGRARKARRGHNRRGTQVRFRPDPQIFGAKARLRPGPALQDGAFQGLSLRRRRDSLVLRSRS